ncbi:hypothetical protein L3Q82_022514 [Scortum barcoo]|uniref:Uncharacterized protein n=1 Tax=Scortum barcoo TaxID=214431 RepID=A0ACB8X1M3_9TELE|nr:hypothetical protein L3Q82_022514 [Scortum barcoo]
MFSLEEARVAFTINHLTGRARLWETAEWERRTPTCESFQAFATELQKPASATDWNEPAQKCDEFLRGLGEYLKDELVFYELHISTDGRIQARRPGETSGSWTPALLISTGPTLSQEEATPNSHTREPEPMQIGRTRLSPEERARRRQGNLCCFTVEKQAIVS